MIETAAVERRSIVLSAQANGTVEPVTVVEVKSKASGTIIRMPVDIGSNVKVGDLLVQIDPRDVQNQYDQAAADLSSATVQRAVALAQRNRSADLFKQNIITAQEMEAATLAFANADASVIKARTNLSIARVRLEDATVQAPTNGTIIERPGLRRHGDHVGDVVGERGHDHSQDGRSEQRENALLRERDRHRQRAARAGGDGDRRCVSEPEVRRRSWRGSTHRRSSSRA